MKYRLICSLCILAFQGTGLLAQNVVTDTLGIVKATAKTPAELLKGEIAGVRVSAIDGNPNGELNVHIRGINTLRGDSQPLWIVDGAVIGSSIRENLDAFFQRGGLSPLGADLPDYSGRSYTSPIGNFGWLNPNDIESIEVVKDLSAAAKYGMQGANGAIIITTRKPKSGERNIDWASNAELVLPGMESIAFKTGVNQNHSISINGLSGNNSYYNVSGFFRYDDGAVQKCNSTDGGIALNFTTMAHSIFNFGLNSFLNYKSGRSTSGVNYVGAPSTMMLARYPDIFTNDSLRGFLDDYDDIAVDFRTVNSVWFRINFLRGLYLQLNGGLDYQNQTRYFWYGTATSFGKDFNAANAIMNNSLFTYNGKAELNFSRSLFVKHRIEASVAIDANGNQNRTNDMCGSNFDIKSLRYRSISSSGSNNTIRKYDRKYFQYGIYGNLKYDYEGGIGIEGTVRADKNARFDKDFTIFPAGQAYLDLAKLFFKKSILSTARIEGGYGTAGREQILPYEYLDTFISDVPSVTSGLEYYFDGIGRLMSKEINAGLRLGFAKDRFTAGAKFFDKTTDDNFRVLNFGKLVKTQWVETSNWTVFQERTSTIHNRGIEADFDFDIIKGRSFRWNMSGNAAYNFDRECKLDILDQASAGLIPMGDSRTIPSIYGGFGTLFGFKGLNIDAKMTGVAGVEILNAAKALSEGHATIQDSDFERGDYLRLDHVSVSYDIPFKTRRIRGFRVSLTGRNLFTLTDYSGWNPDVNSFGVNSRTIGVDYGSYPVFRSIVLGLNVKF